MKDFKVVDGEVVWPEVKSLGIVDYDIAYFFLMNKC